MSVLKRIIKKLVYGYYDSDSYISFLRKKGVSVGNNCKFYSPNTICIDLTRPYGINIGDNVIITQGVTILTHGFDWSVLKEKYSTILGSFGAVSIDDNVFIGTNTTILKGVHINSDVIVGAGSIVTKDLESGYVYAGNPAKKIMTIEEYFGKRIERQKNECFAQIQAYKHRYGVFPPETVLSEFFYLFRNSVNHSAFDKKIRIGGNYSSSLKVLENGDYQSFANYEELLKAYSNLEGKQK